MMITSSISPVFPSSLSSSWTPPLKIPKIEQNSDRWLWIIPTITTIALGMIFVPHFGLGIAIGAIDFTLSAGARIVLEKLHIEEEENSHHNPYTRFIYQYPLLVSLFGPAVEETLTRGGIQPALTHVIQWLVPASHAMIYHSGLTIAMTISILATGILFGALHLSNPHKNSHIQAILAGIGGIVYGVLAAKYGIGTAIASHIANNSLYMIVMSLSLHDPLSHLSS